MRCMVLNATYEFLTIQERWMSALKLVISGKATVLEHYPDVVRGGSVALQVPAVVILNRVVRTRRRRDLFAGAGRRAVFTRDRFVCQYCSRRVSMVTGTRDHVIPRSRGGADTLRNVVTACRDCNARKDDRTPEEAGMRLLTPPRELDEAEKVACLLRTCRTRERDTWLCCLERHGITLWSA